MARWRDVVEEAPGFAAQVEQALRRNKHMTLATLRRDGSPRISGTEAQLRDGELWIGSMWQARKALDLQRDPRYALHGGSDDPPGWSGDAKVAGRAEEVVEDDRVRELNGEAAANGPSHLFRLDIEEASVVELAPGGKELVITVWTPRDGAREIRRA